MQESAAGCIFLEEAKPLSYLPLPWNRPGGCKKPSLPPTTLHATTAHLGARKQQKSASLNRSAPAKNTRLLLRYGVFLGVKVQETLAPYYVTVPFSGSRCIVPEGFCRGPRLKPHTRKKHDPPTMSWALSHTSITSALGCRHRGWSRDSRSPRLRTSPHVSGSHPHLLGQWPGLVSGLCGGEICV